RPIVHGGGVPVEVGGGVRTAEGVETGLAIGAARVIVGTAASRLAGALSSRYSERVAVAVDVKAGRVAVKGWTEVRDLDPISLGRQLVAQGISRFVYTDAGRDGMLAGRVVRGRRLAHLRGAGDPVELAAFYGRGGADELVFRDIGAAVEGRETMEGVGRRTAEAVCIPLTVGGRIRSAEDVGRML